MNIGIFLHAYLQQLSFLDSINFVDTIQSYESYIYHKIKKSMS